MVVVNLVEGIKILKDLKGKIVIVMFYIDIIYYVFFGSFKMVGLFKIDVQIQVVGFFGVWQFYMFGKLQGFVGVFDWVVNVIDVGVKLELLDNGGFKSMV